mgnify:CR=1 FL=1
MAEDNESNPATAPTEKAKRNAKEKYCRVNQPKQGIGLGWLDISSCQTNLI